MNKAYLILGGNIGDRAAAINKAIKKIAEHCGKIGNESSFYETEAWEMQNAPAFLNKALLLETPLKAKEVMKQCIRIENDSGRTRTTGKYESRAIDLDILFFNDEIISEPGLEIPHPRLHVRRFVLEPLCEIAAALIHPTQKKTIAQLLRECNDRCKVEKWKGE